MISKMTFSKEEKKLIEEHNRKIREKTFENNLSETTTRARSVSIGTAFGGTSEISMRRPDGTVTWALLQPVEVVEMIHQLAASIGCHINLQPRKDFASWRQWKVTQEELDHFRGVQHQPGVGHPPHAKAIDEKNNVTQLPPPEQQPGLQSALMSRSKQDDEVMAIKEPVKRGRAKRTTTPT